MCITLPTTKTKFQQEWTKTILFNRFRRFLFIPFRYEMALLSFQYLLSNSPNSPPRVCLFMNTKSRDQTNGEMYTAKTKAFKCATQTTCIPKGASAGTLLIASSPPLISLLSIKFCLIGHLTIICRI